jgi:hypothetical protein
VNPIWTDLAHKHVRDARKLSSGVTALMFDSSQAPTEAQYGYGVDNWALAVLVVWLGGRGQWLYGDGSCSMATVCRMVEHIGPGPTMLFKSAQGSRLLRGVNSKSRVLPCMPEALSKWASEVFKHVPSERAVAEDLCAHLAR